MAQRKASTIRIALYNHKGGVGKTTLTVNIAHALLDLGKRVLLVDSDPQCNLTAYLIESDVVDDLLENSDEPNGNTIWSGVKPIVEGDGGVRIIDAYERRKNLYVLPGDIRLSEYENELLDFWTQCLERKTKGFRGVTAVSQLVTAACRKENIDYVFYDVGPNIGPLNRVILLDCDYFIIPAACDLFSIRALKTLGRTLTNWVTNWRTIATLAPDGVPLLEGSPSYLGYVLQRFRTYGGDISSGYAKFVAQLERQIQSDVLSVLKRVDAELVGSPSQLRMGQIKDFGSGASVSQTMGKPIWEVTSIAQYQRNEARDSFAEIARKIVQRTA